MMPDLAPADHASLTDLVHRLETAWNAMDGAAFSAPFAEDADFVNVRGDHIRGAAAIAAGHTLIFSSIYAGSTNAYTLESARPLNADFAVVHVRARLQVPAGPSAGIHAARFSLVVSRGANGWRIVSFHNTPLASAA